MSSCVYARDGINTYAYVSSDPTLMIELGLAQTKIGGKNITVHKNDVDPWPSTPHGHIYDENYVIDVDGNIYDKATGKLVDKLSKKEIALWKAFLKRAGHSVKCLAPIMFVYDIISHDTTYAVNGALWPVSKLWECPEMPESGATLEAISMVQANESERNSNSSARCFEEAL